MDGMLYFGCVGGPGHHLFAPNLRWLGSRESLPRSAHPGALDGALLDKGPGTSQTQGAAVLRHKDGWTFLAFWDRSVDKRAGSNSVFLAPGTHDFRAMVEAAKEIFPSVWGRFAFPVVLASDAS